MKLESEHIRLRPVDREDATRLLLWENDPDNWKVSGTEVPFSMQSILDYIDQAQHIRSHGQLRLMICFKETGEAIGTLDLYNADFRHLRASVGVLIAEKAYRRQGLAQEALQLAESYASVLLGFHSLNCSIHADNLASVKLFENAGWTNCGQRKDWFMVNKKWVDELLYQKILH